MISIIVPVYNAEKYISRCIQSIINQTYTEWFLILVDDGSSDMSASICDQFAHQDDRIYVIHSTNEGASAARNKGLENAKGEWVTFIDSDDWVESNHLQCFMSQLNKDTDLCINSFVTDLKYGSRPFYYPKLATTNNLQSIETIFTSLKMHFQFLWNKIFRRELIEKHNIRFDTKLSLGEDNVFILDFLNYVNGISSSSDCTYHYDQTDENPLSLGRRKRSNEELCYQLAMNCNAILKLYNMYKLKIVFEYASDYYYTRIFERIIIPNVQYNFGIAKLPKNPFKYFKCNDKLDCSKISNNLIRNFWRSVEKKNRRAAWLILNVYLIQTWLKSKIIKSVVDVRHVFRNVPKGALN